MPQCLLCGSEGSRLRHRIGTFDVRECAECHFVFVSPQPCAADLAHFYKEEYPRNPPPDLKGRRLYSELIDRIFSLHPGGRLLEVGCAWGVFLDEAGKAGYQCAGVELSQECVNFAQDHYGLSAFCGTVEEYASPPSLPFDVVVMRHCLEHTPNPKQTLQVIRRLVSPGGIIVIIVPNIRSVTARLAGRYWEWMCPPIHLHYFSEDSLARLLSISGFSPFRSATCRGDAKNPFFELLRCTVVGVGAGTVAKVNHRTGSRATPVVSRKKRIARDAVFGLTEMVYRGLLPAFRMTWRLGLGEQLEMWARAEN